MIRFQAKKFPPASFHYIRRSLLFEYQKGSFRILEYFSFLSLVFEVPKWLIIKHFLANLDIIFIIFF